MNNQPPTKCETCGAEHGGTPEECIDAMRAHQAACPGHVTDFVDSSHIHIEASPKLVAVMFPHPTVA